VGWCCLLVTMLGFLMGCVLSNKGLCYFVDLFKVEEIVVVMHVLGDGVYGC